ncbi:MAG: efflux RND transporter periplasmic adaptor subunit [Pyrinomonadaceae bacterium]|nr:efflux RND transporter periplasmic adaptor subunit [Pyrinomonadaceae bacterium]
MTSKTLTQLRLLKLARRTFVLIFCAVCAVGFGGCSGRSAAVNKKPEGPAKVENEKPEAQLASLTLTPEAEARLGVRVEEVGFQGVPRTRTFSGEVMLPPDSTTTVTAPVTGTLLVPSQSRAPASGTRVRKGQTIFRLVPLISQSESDQRQLVERDVALNAAAANREVAIAVSRVEDTRVRAARAEQLVRDGGGSVKAAQQVQEELKLAEIDLRSARARYEIVKKTPEYANQEVKIQAPQTAIIQKVHVAPGQTVAGGTGLFDSASYAQMLIRVPVYVGDLNAILPGQSASVHGLGDAPDAARRLARPIAAPPSADPNASTADLYFTLSNTDNRLRPGQRVGVTLQIKTEGESLVVPWSSIIRDTGGGTWVYELTAPHRYERRRVEVRHMTNGMAVLERGPAPGAKVVTAGASELYGTEFGNGK